MNCRVISSSLLRIQLLAERLSQRFGNLVLDLRFLKGAVMSNRPRHLDPMDRAIK